MVHLLSAIKYEQDQLQLAHSQLERLDQVDRDEPDALVAQGCLLFKEDRFEEAIAKFSSAQSQLGFQPEIAYNIAAALFKLQRFEDCMRFIDDIIERGVRDHPELGVGSCSAADDVQVASVGNTLLLRESQLIEAFNLKAAILIQLQRHEAAREAISDMPPRSESELDAVTLHNSALINMADGDLGTGFRKLNFLLSQPESSSPRETLANLLLSYIKHQYYDLAADVLAESSHLWERCLSPELLKLFETLVLSSSQPEEAYRQLDVIGQQHIDEMRKLTKSVMDARNQRDADQIRAALRDYDDAVDRYMPVLMSQAKLLWDYRNYNGLERLFRSSAEFCVDHRVWKVNIGHTFFMKGQYANAISYYEPLVRAQQEARQPLLDITAIILANLCVSYIMCSQNQDAEELMRQIEAEESEAAAQSAAQASSSGSAKVQAKPLYHLCIVNLVIGTLYCSKGNYEFGVTRVIKSLEPYDKKVLTLCSSFISHPSQFFSSSARTPGLMPSDAFCHCAISLPSTCSRSPTTNGGMNFYCSSLNANSTAEPSLRSSPALRTRTKKAKQPSNPRISICPNTISLPRLDASSDSFSCCETSASCWSWPSSLNSNFP